jgi:hypothetical protein
MEPRTVSAKNEAGPCRASAADMLLQRAASYDQRAEEFRQKAAGLRALVTAVKDVPTGSDAEHALWRLACSWVD